VGEWRRWGEERWGVRGECGGGVLGCWVVGLFVGGCFWWWYVGVGGGGGGGGHTDSVKQSLNMKGYKM